MAAEIIALADAIKTAVDAAAAIDTFSQAFASKRTYVPEYEKKDLGEIKLSIVPKGMATGESSVTRMRVTGDRQIDVAFHRLADADDDDTLDGLMLFAEEVTDFIRKNGPYGSNWTWIAVEAPAIYDPESLRQKGIFLAVYTFTFRKIHA